MAIKTSLDGAWRMSYIQERDYLKGEYCPTTVADAEKAANVIAAQVPGNYELDFMRAGIIEDPFYGLNIYKLREYETCHFWFWRDFEAKVTDDDAFLVFEGIDTIADIYLNGKLIAHTENQLIIHEINVTGKLLDGKNELLVHIYPTVIEARKYEYCAYDQALPYNFESIYIRKAGSTFGWDIMCRTVSAGLWRPVRLEMRPVERIKEVYLEALNPGNEGGHAWCSMFFSLNIPTSSIEDYYIETEGICGDSKFYDKRQVFFVAGKFHFSVPNAKLWWPRNKGNASVYDVTVRLIKAGEVIDEYKTIFGIRSIKLDLEENFCFYVNGEKFFAMGSNWVPVDGLHSRDAERLPKCLEMLDDIGCNIVRCWGGNVYENDIFYDFCDRHGILVWQDFGMACGNYPTDEDFQSRLREEAISVVKRLRAHPCIAVWSGDNENDQGMVPNGIDPNRNLLTRRVLPEVLFKHDPRRPYIPSSPFFDEDMFKGKKRITEDHLWGPRDYYKNKFYTDSDCYFASEMGYHGCPSPSSIRKFCRPDKVWPYKDNMDWFGHCTNPIEDPNGMFNYRVELMANQIGELFGEIPTDIDRFAKASQISQAEAKKFFIESFRVKKWRKTGIIWWNLIDGWPQFSDAVVDYYYSKKIAYDYIKRSQQPVCMILGEPENWGQPVYLCNEFTHDVSVKFKITNVRTGETVWQGDASAPANTNVRIGNIKYFHARHEFYLIEWTTSDGVEGKNHYLAGHPGFDLDEYVALAEKAGLINYVD